MEFGIPEELDEIRSAVRALCDGFPGEYWRDLEPDRYPEEFVRALTEHGWLAALIPEEYGGAGLGMTAASAILEEINASGCNSGACHAQMYTMGTILRHGSDEQKQRYLPKIASGELRLQAFGVTEPTVGSDTTSIQTFAERRSRRLRRPRPEDLDLAGALLRSDAAARADDAARRGGAEDRRSVRLRRRHEAGARRRHDDDPPDQDADEPRDDRDLPRRRQACPSTLWSARRARASATSSTG